MTTTAPTPAAAAVRNSKSFDCPNGCDGGSITVTVAGVTRDGRRVWYCSHFQTCDCEPDADALDGFENETIDEARERL